MKAYSVLLVIHQLSHTLETMIPLLLLHFNDPVEVTADVTLELKLECIVATFSLFPSIWYSSEIEEVVTVQRTETEKAISDMKMKKNFLRKVCHVSSKLLKQKLKRNCEHHLLPF